MNKILQEAEKSNVEDPEEINKLITEFESNDYGLIDPRESRNQPVLERLGSLEETKMSNDEFDSDLDNIDAEMDKILLEEGRQSRRVLGIKEDKQIRRIRDSSTNKSKQGWDS